MYIIILATLGILSSILDIPDGLLVDIWAEEVPSTWIDDEVIV